VHSADQNLASADSALVGLLVSTASVNLSMGLSTSAATASGSHGAVHQEMHGLVDESHGRAPGRAGHWLIDSDDVANCSAIAPFGDHPRILEFRSSVAGAAAGPLIVRVGVGDLEPPLEGPLPPRLPVPRGGGRRVASAVRLPPGGSGVPARLGQGRRDEARTRNPRSPSPSPLASPICRG
jgi:hypothetical protein